jgi:hypothetical protein
MSNIFEFDRIDCNFGLMPELKVLILRLQSVGNTHKHVIYQYGFGLVWLMNEIGDKVDFRNVFTQRLKDCSRQSFLADIGMSPKAISYKMFKSLKSTYQCNCHTN